MRPPKAVSETCGKGSPASFSKRAGIDEVLLKPFSVEEIERALERQLHNRFEGGESTTWNRRGAGLKHWPIDQGGRG